MNYVKHLVEHNIYGFPTSNTSTGSSSADITKMQQVFISLNGSDTTGDGSVNNPYATISKALLIIPNTYTASWSIVFAAGQYDIDNLDIELPPNVSLIGQGASLTIIYGLGVIGQSTIVPSSEWETIDSIILVKGISFLNNNGLSINFDLATIGGGVNGKIELQDVIIESSFEMRGRPFGSDYITIRNTAFLGTCSIFDSTITVINNVDFQNELNVDATADGYSNQEVQILNTFMHSNSWNFTAANGIQLSCYIRSSVSGGLYTSGGGIILIESDLSSIPIDQTLSANTTITKIGEIPVKSIYGEDHSGECDGVTSMFIVDQSKYIAGKLRVYINNLRSFDFVETDPTTGQFTMNSPPLPDENGISFRLDYNY